jgi:hypothetical protein
MRQPLDVVHDSVRHIDQDGQPLGHVGAGEHVRPRVRHRLVLAGGAERLHPVEHQRDDTVRLLPVHRAVLEHLHQQVHVEPALEVGAQVGAVRGEALQPPSQLEAERANTLAAGRGGRGAQRQDKPPPRLRA